MLTTLSFPYGRTTLNCRLEADELKAVLTSSLKDYQAALSEEDLVRKALENPIGCPRLAQLSAGKKNITVITSDHTRPMPSRITMPLLLSEIRKGSPEACISILVATGTHRAATREELLERFGDEIVSQENIYIHNCDDASSMTILGDTPGGNTIAINRLAAEADLLIAEGFIEPHFFAGFSGGRKSIMPGIASRGSIMYNHCAPWIADPHSVMGSLEHNPIHEDMVFAARKSGLAFILNVVLNHKKEIIGAYAGDMEEAHREGVAFLSSLCACPASPADIVIVSNGGFPLDQNIYQSVKGMATAARTCRKGGVIIIVSQCADGHGGESFYHTFSSEPDTKKIMDSILSQDPKATIPDQWQSQILCSILLHHPVILVSDVPKEMAKKMHLLPASSIEEAVQQAKSILKLPSPSITAVMDGPSIIIQ